MQRAISSIFGVKDDQPNGNHNASDDPSGSAASEQLLNQLSNRLRPYLDAAEELMKQKCGSATKLPSIVVIGDQSEGKSTVLWAISGLKFPTDTRLSTKCPIQLSLRRGDHKLEISYPIGGRIKSQTVSQVDFESKIKEAQEELVRSNGSQISEQMIKVKLFRPDGYDLTLIDLPGINRQTDEIENRTIQLIEHFIESDQTIILVVFKATADVSAVKSFQLSRKFDPSGSRTIGVITHCDSLTDNWGEQIGDLISGSGSARSVNANTFIPVSCLDFIQYGPEAELRTLRTRPVFSSIDSRRIGTRQLIVTLGNEILRKLTPWTTEIIGLVKWKCGELQAELSKELDGVPTEAEGCKKVATNLLSTFSRELNEQLTGTQRCKKNVLYSFIRRQHDKYAEKIRAETEKQKEEKTLVSLVKEELQDQQGCEANLAVNVFPAMRRIVQKLVKDAYSPLTKVLFDCICTTVEDHMRGAIREEFHGLYPDLLDYIQPRLQAILDERRKIAQGKIDDILDLESACISTKNRHFIEATRSVPNRLLGDGAINERNPDGANALEGERSLTFDEARIYHLTKEYLDVLADRVIDTVCNTMQYHLNCKLGDQVFNIQDKLPEQQLLQELMQDPDRAERLNRINGQLDFWRQLHHSLEANN